MSDRLRRPAALLAITALLAAAGCGGYDSKPAKSGKATSTPSGGKSKPSGY